MTALVTTKVNALAAARTFGTAAGSPAHRRALVANPSEVLAEAGVVPSGTQVRLVEDGTLTLGHHKVVNDGEELVIAIAPAVEEDLDTTDSPEDIDICWCCCCPC